MSGGAVVVVVVVGARLLKGRRSETQEYLYVRLECEAALLTK